ncbi:MAG TPA: hypothetical protein VL027_04080 [Spongiibacteraceae bacterium]|nr:hypothetical protein [Spongiibacteraceae bacterium]
MASKVPSTESKDEDISEDFLADSSDGDDGDFDDDRPLVIVRRDPDIRRKIEDRLERLRLREELGIYDFDFD